MTYETPFGTVETDFFKRLLRGGISPREAERREREKFWADVKSEKIKGYIDSDGPWDNHD